MVLILNYWWIPYPETLDLLLSNGTYTLSRATKQLLGLNHKLCPLFSNLWCREISHSKFHSLGLFIHKIRYILNKTWPCMVWWANKCHQSEDRPRCLRLISQLLEIKLDKLTVVVSTWQYFLEVSFYSLSFSCAVCGGKK